ncbi:DUF1905 domain-containing protein [Clostridium sp. C2-6-12]|uniref:DUF1905 domain-containing protein n=1 Tax=Clostridium sp. C2-6-12 TaxID=2698832 RepID=UPI001FAD4427|nr:DUF1905 domain-containing protein [Clostridium sp. C2-6-12]
MSGQRFDFLVDDEKFLKGRTLIDLPFNVWEVFGVKGVIAVKTVINGVEFKLNLVPRGKGNYSFFLNSVMKKHLKIQKGTLLNVSINILDNKVKEGVEVASNEKPTKTYKNLSQN